MKKIFALLLLSAQAEAQTAEEWLRQKETARKYSLAQLAALQARLGVVKKGYAVIQAGLETIREIKEGDFQQHQAFFTSLKSTNPAIQKGSLVGTAATLLLEQVQDIKETRRLLTTRRHLSRGEKEDAENLLSRLLVESLHQAAGLTLLTGAASLQLNDADRLKRIEALLEEIMDSLVFLRTFRAQLAGLDAHRAAEKAAIDHIRKIRGL